MFGSNSLLSVNDSSKVVGAEEAFFLPSMQVNESFREHTRNTFTNDLMILKLNKEINMTIDHDKFIVNTICLPNKDTKPFSKYAIASGWGATTLEGAATSILKVSIIMVIANYPKFSQISRGLYEEKSCKNTKQTVDL